MQNALMAIAHHPAETVAAIVGLRARAKAAGVPIVTVQHHDDTELPTGTEGWRIVSGLEPGPDETVVPKNSADSFLDTDLDAALRELGVTEVVVTGFATEMCVDTTARSALSHRYDLVLVADGHTTSLRPDDGPYVPADESIAHHNEIFRNIGFPGRRIRVLPAAEVDFTTAVS